MDGDTALESARDMVSLLVSSSVNSFTSERRFPTSIPISDLKAKLEILTGAPASAMQLELYDSKDKLVEKIGGDDSAILGSFLITPGMRLHVIDPTHKPGEFEDLSSVPKYSISEESYAKRTESIRAFLMQQKLGQYSDDKGSQTDKEKEAEEAASKIHVGDRCEIRTVGQVTRRGTVMFVGKTQFKPGWWVGVKCDEPLGKNDGSVAGVRYFECPPKYGSFVRPQDVTVGDFPEIADYESDEI